MQEAARSPRLEDPGAASWSYPERQTVVVDDSNAIDRRLIRIVSDCKRKSVGKRPPQNSQSHRLPPGNESLPTPCELSAPNTQRHRLTTTILVPPRRRGRF